MAKMKSSTSFSYWGSDLIPCKQSKNIENVSSLYSSLTEIISYGEDLIWEQKY